MPCTNGAGSQQRHRWYLLSLAVFIPISGWITDRLAQGGDMQELGGALMVPVGRLILARSFPRYLTMAVLELAAIAGFLVLRPSDGGDLLKPAHPHAVDKAIST